MNEDDLVPRLLSGRKRLSRLEKDVILERVFTQVAPSRRSRVWLGASLSALAGLAAVVFFLTRPAPELVARGVPGPPFRLRCESDGPRCHVGGTLWFDFGGSTPARYFAAFARSARGTVIWYFPPSEAEQSVDLKARLRRGVLDRGVQITAEYAPGTYEMYGVLSDAPLGRDAVRNLAESGAPRVVKQTFIVDQRP